MNDLTIMHFKLFNMWQILEMPESYSVQLNKIYLPAEGLTVSSHSVKSMLNRKATMGIRTRRWDMSVVSCSVVDPSATCGSSVLSIMFRLHCGGDEPSPTVGSSPHTPYCDSRFCTAFNIIVPPLSLLSLG